MTESIGSSGSSNLAQSVVPGKSTQKSQKHGLFKYWTVKAVAKCKKMLFQVKKTLSSEPRGIDLKKMTRVSGEVISAPPYKSSGMQGQVKIRQREVDEILTKRPNTNNECEHLIRMLESRRDGILSEPSGQNQPILQSINNRIDVLRGRLVSSCSSYNEGQFKLLKIKSALDLIEKKAVPGMDGVKSELMARIEKLDRAALKASKTDHLTKDRRKELKNYPKMLVKMMAKAGLKVTISDIKECSIDLLNREQWHEINKVGSVVSNGQEYHFKQQCTPACMMTARSTTNKDGSDPKEKVVNIFPEDYRGKGVTAHAIKGTTHASNLFTSRLINEKTHKEDFAIVRHGVNSPYGLNPGKERSKGAVNRAKEVVLAGISLKPELLEMACQGKTVNFMMTSTSLLTPDPFRGVFMPLADEKVMLEDQLAAYNTLANENPVTLNIRTADGTLQEIRVNLELVPFNFGVNTFAVDAISDKIGGWKYSDSINDKSFQHLIGSTKPGASHGGIVGRWLDENKTHPDAEIVKTLVKQIREIYSSKSHRALEGGAYKLPARLIVLTRLIGGVPCTNCKSGKDRTSASVGVAEALFTGIRMHGEVPSWHEVSEDQSHLVKEFCFQGAHHDIQRLNTGVAGFKIEDAVFKEYGMNESEMNHARGLSDIVSR
ncbi:MAG: inositol phosphate phosphatase SopB [Candidatus Endonucleobacter sp. (ex Gigantidas childressi)]|nr:inositol phosphate phosphatase SopB [Candidatus Endonucleobacter sp. (ex Gigantidas childressi)]